MCYVWPPLFPGLHGGEEVVWIRSYLPEQSLKLLDVLHAVQTVKHAKYII